MLSTADSSAVPTSKSTWATSAFSSIYPELLSLLLRDVPLQALLNNLVQLLRNTRGPSTRAAVFIHDAESCVLRFGASVGIAPGYTEAVDGFPVEECMPACGSAAFYGRDEIVENVHNDLKWQPFLHLSNEFDFQACWSFVLMASSGECLGTLALYHADRCLPTEEDADQIRYFVKSAALLIERHLKQNALNSDLGKLDELVRASSGTGMSLSIVAHELRNPISAISAALQALQFGGDDPSLRKRALAVLDRQTKQMEWLVEDLIDVERASQNVLCLLQGTHNLYDILRFAIETVHGEFEKKQQNLNFDNCTLDEIRVDGDFRRLAQVFINVLGNASKFSPAGSVVEVKVVHAPQVVTVLVEDHGIGLKIDDTARIFHMFEQVQNTRCAGLGIGLALVKRLIELHGGSVAVRSPGIGHGSVFEISLPISAHAV